MDASAGTGNPVSIPMVVGSTSLTRSGADVVVGVTLTATQIRPSFSSLNIDPTSFDPSVGQTTTIFAGSDESLDVDIAIKQGAITIRRLLGEATPSPVGVPGTAAATTARLPRWVCIRSR